VKVEVAEVVTAKVVNLPVEAVEAPMEMLSKVEVVMESPEATPAMEMSQVLESIATEAELLPKAVTPVDDKVVKAPEDGVEPPIDIPFKVEVEMPPEGVKRPSTVRAL